MRTLLAWLLMTGAASAATYGTPGACAAVEAGTNPAELTTGIEGVEYLSWFLSDTIYVGPEMICDIDPVSGRADCGAEGIDWSETPVIIRGDTEARIELENQEVVTIPKCR